MFEDLVSTILSTYLGDFVEGISKKDLKTSIWNGSVQLTDLNVKSDALDFLELPIKVKEGFIGKVTMTIPWKKLGKKPTMIEIEDVYILTNPISDFKYDEEKEKEKENKKKQEQLMILEENEMNIRDDGSLNAGTAMYQLVSKIVGNFEVQVNRIHIRLEDHSTCPNRPFCAGIVLNKLFVYTPEMSASSGPLLPGAVNKRLMLDNLGIYWESNQKVRAKGRKSCSLRDNMIIPFLERDEINLDKISLLPTHYMLEPVSFDVETMLNIQAMEKRRMPIDDTIRIVMEENKWSDKIGEYKTLADFYKEVSKERKEETTSDQEWSMMRKLLIDKYGKHYPEEALRNAKRFCDRCWLISRDVKPIIMVNGSMESFVLKLEEKQYNDIVEYINAVCLINQRAKYRKFYPKKKFEESPRDWWKYAINSIVDDNKKERNRCSWSTFVTYKKLRSKYVELYREKVSTKNGFKDSPHKLTKLQKLEDNLTPENIMLFRRLALSEIENENLIKKKIRKQKTKQKISSSFLGKIFKKKGVAEEAISEEDIWNEERKLQLMKEYSVNPEERSPWIGGDDGVLQITVDVRVNRVGLGVWRDKTPIFHISSDNMLFRMYKHVERYECWCRVDDCSIVDESDEAKQWKYIMKTEKREYFDENNIDCLPKDMLVSSIPFIQIALDIPNDLKDKKIQVRCCTLPIVVIVNTACIMDIINFFLPPIVKIGVIRFGSSLHSFVSNRLKNDGVSVRKDEGQVKLYNKLAFDCVFGAANVIIPSNPRRGISECECIVMRTGDIRVESCNDVEMDNPDEKNAYNSIRTTVSRMNIMFSHYLENWSSQEMISKYDLQLVSDFSLHCLLSLSVLPVAEYAKTKLYLEMDIVNMKLTRTKYLWIKNYIHEFKENWEAIKGGNKVNIEDLTMDAKNYISREIGKRGTTKGSSISTPTPGTQGTLTDCNEEEKLILEKNRRLSLHCVMHGMNILLEDVSSANEHTKLINATMSEIVIKVNTRTFDNEAHVFLKSIEVVDCLQTASCGQKKYLLLSNHVDKEGEIMKEMTDNLIDITVEKVEKRSPLYKKKEADLIVNGQFGMLSLMVYRPTIYQLCKFIAPQKGKKAKVEEEKESEQSSVMKYLSSILADEREAMKTQTESFIEKKTKEIVKKGNERVVTNWTRKSLLVTLKTQSLDALITADNGRNLLYISIQNTAFDVSLCPAYVLTHSTIEDITILDASIGCGNYPSILSINHSQIKELLSVTIAVFPDRRYPKYPGYSLMIDTTVAAPVFVLRMRILRELAQYFKHGIFAECRALFVKEDVQTTDTKMGVIEEAEKDDSISAHLKSSIKDSLLTLGMNFLFKKSPEIEHLPFILPLISIRVMNGSLSIPASSDSSEVVTYYMGDLSIRNQKPDIFGEKPWIVDWKTYEERINTVAIELKNMKATTSLMKKEISLLGGINASITIDIGTTIAVIGTISKMAFTVNEQQLSFFVRMIRGNFEEKAIVCVNSTHLRKIEFDSVDTIGLEEEKEEEEEEKEVRVLPKGYASRREVSIRHLSQGIHSDYSRLSVRNLSVIREEEDDDDAPVDVGQKYRIEVSFEGASAEFLQGEDGYESSMTGTEIYETIGKKETSISYLDVGTIRFLLNAHKYEISTGLSLSHVSIHDTRVKSSIHPAYRNPITFGDCVKPAIALHVLNQSKDIHKFMELMPYYKEKNQIVSSIVISLAIGSLKIIPTPWMFDMYDMYKTFMKDVIGEKGDSSPVATKLEQEIGEKQENRSLPLSMRGDMLLFNKKNAEKIPFGPNIIFNMIVENPCIYIVENSSQENSSSFALTYSMDCTCVISPLMNMDAKLHVCELRACRSHPSDRVLPETSMIDLLQPLDYTLALNVKDDFKCIQGSFCSSDDMKIHMGIVDMKLLHNAMNNLIPDEILTVWKKKRENSNDMNGERIEEKRQEDEVNDKRVVFKVELHSVSIAMVNDTESCNVPILHFLISNLQCDCDMKESMLFIMGNLSIFSEYYNVHSTNWETLIDEWTMNCIFEREERNRIVQKLSLLSQPVVSKEYCKKRLMIEAPSMLTMNVTNVFVNLIMRSIQSFRECNDTSLKVGEGFFIKVRNTTGLSLTVTELNDNYIKQLVMERESRKAPKKQNDLFFAGIADVEFDTGIATCWVTLYTSTPCIRVYNKIPIHDEHHALAWSDSLAFDHSTNGMFKCVCSFKNATNSNSKIRIYVESDKEREIWKAAINRLMNYKEPFVERKQRLEEQFIRKRVEMNSLDNTSMITTSYPCHPSLTLMYLEQHYKMVDPRTLEIIIPNCPPFVCDVDHTECFYAPVHFANEKERKIIVNTVVEGSEKILSLESTISIVNKTKSAIRCGFGKYCEESEIGFADVSSVVLNRNGRNWCGDEVIDEIGLFLGCGDELNRCIHLKEIIEGDIYSTVNVSNDRTPMFVNVMCRKRTVYNMYNGNESITKYEIILADVIVFENLLPYTINYQIINKNERVLLEGSLKEGGEVNIMECGLNRKSGYRISIKIEDDVYPFSDYKHSIDLLSDNGVVYLNHKLKEKSLNLNYISSCNKHNTVILQLYCKYWVINKTGDNLLIRDRNSESFVYTVQSLGLSLKRKSEVVLSKEKVIMPTLISMKNEDKYDSIRVSLPDYDKWSTGFSIISGTQGECLIQSKDNKKSGRAYCISIQRAPGIYARSSVVVITPMYIVVNEMDIPVEIRQMNTEMSSSIKPAEYKAYHWQNQELAQKLQLFLPSQPYQWSKGFTLSSGHYCLQLKREKRTRKYDAIEREEVEDPLTCTYSTVQVDVVIVDTQCYIFIKKNVSTQKRVMALD